MLSDLDLNFAPKSLQMLKPQVLSKSEASVISYSPFRSHVECRRPLACRLGYLSTLLSSRKLQGRNLKLACRASFNDFFDDELSKRIEELAQGFGVVNDVDENVKETACLISETSGDFRVKEGKKSRELDISVQFLPSKIELLEPSLLGIRPEPPEWPERDEVSRISIEQKANNVNIPLSLRIIKRKQKWLEGFVDEGDFAYCSLKKAFSSLVFIIRELQNHALQIRESLYSEDLQVIMSKVQREINASFGWLFQQVFSRTPTLMFSVMILLANFMVYSVADNAAFATTLASGLPYCTEKDREEQPKHCSSTSVLYPRVVSDEVLKDYSFEMNDEEAGLWNSMAEEASRMQRESFYNVLDHELMQQIVSPVTVEFQPDDYEDYFRTDLLYQMGIAEEPNNPLLLLNYAQFLYLVARDHERAEECFKRAIQAEPPDAEALSQYADFLWKVKKELWEAEERYQQAMAIEPENSYHASKYANFLWSTGGEETCYPLSSSHDSFNKVS